MKDLKEINVLTVKIMKSYLNFILILFVIVNAKICNSQTNETNKLLTKARALQGYNTVRNKVSQDIYNNLIAKEPTNAVYYAESGFFNLNHADKELGMADLNLAMYLLEKKVCTCDSEHIIASNYDSEKKIFVCSIELLEKIYRNKWNQFDHDNKLDSSSIYINKLIRLYTDSSGTKPDFSKFEHNEIAIYKLNELYKEQAQNFGGLHHYRDALLSFKKMTNDGSFQERNMKYIDFYAIIGEYDSVLQIMQRELFIKTDSEIRFTNKNTFKASKYFLDYLSAYISKRDFESAFNLLNNNTTLVPNPDVKGKNMKVLMKDFPMYQKGESDNNCDSIIRINQYTSDYSFFHYFTCILNDLKIKDYENALKCLNSFYKIMEPDLLKLESSSVTNLNGDIYKSDYAFFSLKGYLLSKLNKKAEAKLAYQEALKLNPECKEAMDELKLLQ
ncbi:MAG: hypothetical protein CFE25_16305 [Chitinophagaceae bacterium BSSC1]|nr:MAG: hypothetical protein CFE25_16305 [Chitinophagaceae bacterium BSSC1]